MDDFSFWDVFISIFWFMLLFAWIMLLFRIWPTSSGTTP